MVRRKNAVVNTPTLKEKAGFFANGFGITDFGPSDDWVACSKCQFNIQWPWKIRHT